MMESIQHKIRSALRLFLMTARLGFKQAYVEKLPLVGRFLLIATIVTAYAGVYKNATPADLERVGLSAAKMIWYIAATEFILFTATAPFKDLQFDIQAGFLSTALLRPCSIWFLKIAEWMGQAAANLVFLCIPCGLLAGFLSGDYSYFPSFLFSVFFCVPLAIFLVLGVNFIVGASCVWTHQSEPLYWVFQKLLFLLGALLWPLALYPDVMQKMVWLTPFPAMMAASGLITIGSGAPFLIFLHQLFFCAILLWAVKATERALRRRIQKVGE